ncbi:MULTISPECIES: TRAFAC clade GTPase domain-containing protein [unclassified Streptomyces]|uniref:TRAFAC clade GTPase domain-containing protein n=1 Tax=unclassified Streptomyces TaxID=2593676 RepID=UPI002E2BA2DC|nr:hypothetical protein [Streptomyces sp. NBC_00223]
MDIVMLGHSAAGKTTYVSLMYAAMREGVEGLSLRAEDPYAHRSLMRAAEAVLRGHYPPASDQRAVFDLVLQHNGRDVFPFRWRDYRGGTLLERAGTSPQAAQLHEDLTQAQGIILFADAPRLLNHASAAGEVRRMTVHVLRALQARGEALTPVVLTLTKCDLVDMDDEGVLARLIEPFQQLIDGIAATEHLFGALVPVSCGPSPVNVAVPVLWSLHFGVVGRAMQLRASADERFTAARQAAAKDTLGDRISSWWKSEPSWAAISARHQLEAQAELARLEPLAEPAERLGSLLEDVASF